MTSAAFNPRVVAIDIQKVCYCFPTFVRIKRMIASVNSVFKLLSYKFLVFACVSIPMSDEIDVTTSSCAAVAFVLIWVFPIVIVALSLVVLEVAVK